MIPTAHTLIPRTKADAKEVVEDPYHRQSRYGQHHPHDAEESPAHYHGQQDRDRVDVKSPSLDADLREHLLSRHFVNWGMKEGPGQLEPRPSRHRTLAASSIPQR